MHLITLSGHLAIVAVTLIDSALQTPMYFFLRNLSSIEVCYTLVIVPKMLSNFLAKSRRVSLTDCATQMYFFIALGGAECFLLAVMAYDRYVAICNPLRYAIIMSRSFCVQLLVVAFVSGFTISLGLTTLIFRMPFCGSHKVNHFFCDIPPMLFLACSDTHANELAMLLVCMMILLIPFLLILVSYVFIANSIFRWSL
uniref:olfactory receptor 10A4-like n=1 Tax=Euleptes europaea TaxID=460621 RepID=UPI0025401C74|nr:olfactory receptor 10A4-like [Euleptes europaea]